MSLNTRSDLKPLIIEALRLRGGKARIPEIGKHIWERYRADLERAGDFFSVWQYEMRWAGNQLVNEGKLIKNRDGWELDLAKRQIGGTLPASPHNHAARAR